MSTKRSKKISFQKPKRPPKPDFSFTISLQKQGYQRIIGLDEVGRGALAGPIVVAAIELPTLIDGIFDSKLVSKQKRTELFQKMYRAATQLRFGHASNQEIDQLGITAALHLAYERALNSILADVLLTDCFLPNTTIKTISSVKGDQLFYPAAAASIAAKVHRDQLMTMYSHFLPYYGWQQNVGYGTRAHLTALQQFGPSRLHRRTFL